MAKDVEIKARVTTETRDRMQALADERGESISLMLREAIRDYLAKASVGPPKKAPAGGGQRAPGRSRAAAVENRFTDSPPDSPDGLSEKSGDQPQFIAPAHPARGPVNYASPRPRSTRGIKAAKPKG